MDRTDPRASGSLAGWLLLAGALVTALVGLFVWVRHAPEASDGRSGVADSFIRGIEDGDVDAANAVVDPRQGDGWAPQISATIAWIREHDAALDHVEARSGGTSIAVFEAAAPTQGLPIGELSVTVDQVDGRSSVVAWSWRLREPLPTGSVSPPPVGP
jgi:hypothetical protein